LSLDQVLNQGNILDLSFLAKRFPIAPNFRSRSFIEMEIQGIKVEIFGIQGNQEVCI